MKYLLFFISFYFHLPGNAQKFYNLDFGRQCDSSATGLCSWDLSWGNKTSVKHQDPGEGKYLLLEGNKKTDVVFVEQASSFSPVTDIRIITVTATISSEDVEGKGTGLNIGLYDVSGNMLSFKDMGNLYSLDWLRGTSKWKTYSISLVCPPETGTIKIGAILYGKGKAWFRNYKVSIAPLTTRTPSGLAFRFISAACDSIQKHSLVRDSLNIESLKKIALKVAGPAKTFSDCYLAVEYLVKSLQQYGDYHSFFMKKKEVVNWLQGGSQISRIEYPWGRNINGCGYLYVPPFHGGNKKSILAYADTLQAILRRFNNSGIAGWIVDLRNNTGGNQEPMIAGLGPLFDAGKLGSLVDVYGNRESWYYRDGTYFWEQEKILTVTRPAVLNTKLPIAVLTSASVGSSGEIVTISFIGNSFTKSFGQPTMGLTTGNGSYDLPGGSKIFIASTIMADRSGKLYTGRVVPDLTIETGKNPNKDEEIEAAVKWILK